MRKQIRIGSAILAGVLAVCMMTACVKSQTGKTDANQGTGKETTENVQIANPFVECATIGDAEKLAGFSIRVPESVVGYDEKYITAIEEDMIEVQFSHGEDAELWFRKGVGAEDISGDYNVYKEEKSVEVQGQSVMIKGTENGYKLAIWNANGYAYAIGSTTELSEDTLVQYISELMDTVEQE